MDSPLTRFSFSNVLYKKSPFALLGLFGRMILGVEAFSKIEVWKATWVSGKLR